MKRAGAGFTMSDAVLLMMLVTVVLIPLSGMFPLGHVAVGKARNLSVALFLAKEHINKIRTNFPASLMNSSTTPFETVVTETVGGTPYTVTTDVWTVETRGWILAGNLTSECDMVDVEVTVDYPGGTPFVYSTRLFEDMSQFQTQ